MKMMTGKIPLFLFMTQRRIYQDNFPYLITSCVYNGIWFFEKRKHTKLLYPIIIKACQLKSFDFYAFCILPNHLHLLVKQKTSATTEGCAVDCWGYPNPTAQASLPHSTAQASLPAPAETNYNISNLMHSVKSYFAKEIRDRYGVDYKIWQTRFNFRIIDTSLRFENTVNYIQYNYKKINLSNKYSEHPFLYMDWKRIRQML